MLANVSICLLVDCKSWYGEATVSILGPNTLFVTMETELTSASIQNQVTFICRLATRHVQTIAMCSSYNFLLVTLSEMFSFSLPKRFILFLPG